jgi:hypothetical protein
VADTILLDSDGNAPATRIGSINVALSGVAAGEAQVGLAALIISSGAEGGRTGVLVDSTNPLPVSDAGSSLTVDAPVGTPVFVRLSDGSAPITTLPVSLASVPSHAVTNAGTFATQVDGAALTALQLIDNLPNTLGSTTSGQSGALALGAVTTAAPSYTTAQTNALSLTTSGLLRVAIEAGAGSGGTASVDDAAFTVAVGSGTPMMGVVTADAVDSGDVGVVGMTTSRALHVSLQTGSATIGALTANQSVNVAQINGVTPLMGNGASGTGAHRVTIANDSTGILAAVTNVATIGTSVTPGTSAAHLGKAVDSPAGATDTGVLALAVRDDALATLTPVDGDFTQLRVNSQGALWVTGTAGTSIKVDDATFTPGTDNVSMVGGTYRATRDTLDDTDGGAIALTQRRAVLTCMETPAGDSVIDDTNDAVKVVNATAANFLNIPSGNVAHDAADSGNPVKVGAKALAAASTATMVVDADRTDLRSDLDGAILVRQGSPLGDTITERVTNTDGASTAFTNFGATASTRNVIESMTVFRTDAGATLAYVDVRDGTGGAILWSLPLPPNGGSILPPGTRIRSSVNTALAFDVSAALTTVIISASGYKSKV